MDVEFFTSIFGKQLQRTLGFDAADTWDFVEHFVGDVALNTQTPAFGPLGH